MTQELDYTETVNEQSPPARILYHIMSAISERCYCAGWMDGTEASCWDAVLNGATRWGMGEISEEEADDMRWLSEQAWGWWQWTDEGAEFLPISRWKVVYAARWGSKRLLGDGDAQ